MIEEQQIPKFLAQFFTTAPRGSFSIKQRDLAQSLSRFVDSDLFGLYLLEKENYPLATLVSQPRQEMIREYEYYRNQDPLFQYLLQQGGAVEGVELLGEEQWLRNPVGQMLQRWQMQYTIQGAISVHGRVIGTLNFARAPDAGRFHQVDTLKVAALCREVSQLLESDIPVATEENQIDWNCDTFVTSPRSETAELILTTDAEGHSVQPEALPDQYSDIYASGLEKVIKANIQELRSDQHQLVERTVFCSDHRYFSLLTLPLPGHKNFYTTIIKNKAASLGGITESTKALREAAVLGARTQQALALLIKGYSNKLIAREMGISENTVKDHIRRIYKHYGVNNRTELTWRLRALHGQ